MDSVQSTPPQARRIAAALAAAASAAIIAFGVAVLGWSVFEVTAHFCFENVVP